MPSPKERERVEHQYRKLPSGNLIERRSFVAVNGRKRETCYEYFCRGVHKDGTEWTVPEFGHVADDLWELAGERAALAEQVEALTAERDDLRNAARQRRPSRCHMSSRRWFREGRMS